MNGAPSAFLQILNTKCYYKTINVNFFAFFSLLLGAFRENAYFCRGYNRYYWDKIKAIKIAT